MLPGGGSFQSAKVRILMRRRASGSTRRSFFARVPLPEGDIDYRFAIAAMLAANYPGYLAIEGAQLGDQLTQDRRGLEYARALLSELSAIPAHAASPR